jgi:hypothetical protein
MGEWWALLLCMTAHQVPLTLVLFVTALTVSSADGRPSMKTAEATKEQTCGQELAASAEVPQRWQDRMNHVATNLEWHANWVGADSNAAKQEHDALMRVARAYRAIATASARAAGAMKAMKDLEPAPHAPSKFDREGQTRWMQAKIQMQRELATLLMQHAADSERALAEIQGLMPP